MNENHDLVIQRRPHLSKEQRLPKCYKEVEKIIKSVKSCQTNFKTALATSRLRGSQFKKVYKLSLNVLKYYNYIQKIIDKSELLKNEKFLRREIATILIYELIFGNGILPGESKAVTTVQAYQNDLMTVHQELENSNEDFGKLNEIYIPRYARVHTLVTSVACVIKDLQSYGFNQIFYDVDLSEEKFYELVKSLEKNNFLIDFHFKDMLVFSPTENLVELDLYQNGHIFLQDKASYIPVHALNPEPGATVLDACAAPGMKSAHIASKMKNKGILIACERDESRFETLKETLKYGSVKISRTLCTDFKLVHPNDEAYSSVDYILLDPSCSGSGMVNRMDNITDTENSKTKERLLKLAGFQIILLKHALKFPSVKRVVYSTCSIHEEENEYVVQEALNSFGDVFKLVPVVSGCFDRGSENYNIGNMCLRTVPEKHLTNGFFVAMFERNEIHKYRRKNFSGKHFKNESVKTSDDKSLESGSLEMDYKASKRSQNSEDMTQVSFTNDSQTAKHSKYKKKEKKYMTDIYYHSYEQDEEVPNIDSTLKEDCENNLSMSEKITKHKRHSISDRAFEKLGINNEILLDVRLKHKKKKKKTDEQCNSSNVLDQSAEDLDQDIIGIHDNFSPESKKLKTSELSKLEKRDKEGKNKLKCNKQNQMENSKATFSESQKNSEISDDVISLLCTGKEIASEHPLCKEKPPKGNSEIIQKYEIFDDYNFKHKAKKRKKEHSYEENIHIHSQETEHVNKRNSFHNKQEKVKESSKFKLSCIETGFENKCLKQDINPPDTLKKHKKHSRNSDFTSSELNICDFSKSESKTKTCSEVKSAENLTHVSQIEMTDKQYLIDNYSKCRKSKKHKKHASKSNELDGTVFSPERNVNSVASYVLKKEDNQTFPLHPEENSINSPSEHHVKKKRKKHKKVERDSLNFQYSDTKEQHSNRDVKNNLVQNDMQSVVTSTENYSIAREKRKKSKKHLTDDVYSTIDTTVKKNVEEEKAPSIGINSVDSFHSETRSKNCTEIKNHSTEITFELHNPSLPKEPENTLVNSSKKKKKKHMKEKEL